MTFSGKVKNCAKNITWFVRNYRNVSSICYWESRSWDFPAPVFVKHSVLLSRPAEIWIETGTFLGETTRLLEKHSSHVTSIEADADLFSQAKANFSGPQVDILFGKSPDLLGNVIQSYIQKDYRQINFYLDAHYSGPGTYFSSEETPIVRELEVIGSFLTSLDSCNIFIDDLRMFPDIAEVKQTNLLKYPTKRFLVQFAEQHQLSWTVQHDIFIMFKKS